MWYDILRIASKNLFRYRSKTLSIIIPVMLIISIFSAMLFVQKGLQRDAWHATRILPDITLQRVSGGRVEIIDLSIIDKISALKEIKKIVPRVWGYVPVEDNKNVVAYTLMGVDLDKTEIPELINLTVKKGRFLKKHNPDEAVVGETFASSHNLSVNDIFRLKDTFGNEEILKIAGIFSSDVQIYTSDMILVNIEKARNFFTYKKNEATDLNIFLYDKTRADVVAGKLLKLDRNLRVFTRAALKDLMVSSFDERSGIFQILWIILLINCCIISLTQGIHMGVDLKKETGIMKVLGWSTMDIIKIKIIESFVIGFIGTIGGIITGILYLKAGAPGIKQYFLGWARIFPDFEIPVYLEIKTMVILFLIGIIPLMVSSIIPSWLVGITEPDKAIRY